MKVLILYRERSDHARAVDTFIRDFQIQHREVPVETVELDSREGSLAAKNYDITAYPAILALKDDGAVLQLWQGAELPLMSEVASYSY
jgi:hypothetical protein